MGMGITQFSQRTGLSRDSLRRLHRSGKLIPAHVTRGGFRRYEESQAAEAVKFVKSMKLLTDGSNVVGDGPLLDPFFAYLLGLVMADGTVSKTGQVQLEMKDFQIMRDVGEVLGVEVHPRSDRDMYQLTVPSRVACQLIEFGVCRNKSQGFEVPRMSECSFGHFLRGLFDGDGSVSVRGNCITIRFHGHPKSMAYVQATLLGHFGVYMAWVPDNRIHSGMLEIGNQFAVRAIRDVMYESAGVCLDRKQKLLFNP